MAERLWAQEMIIAAKESGRQTDQGDSRSAFLEGRRYQLFCAPGGEALLLAYFLRPTLAVRPYNTG